jgi:hypothetical protein
MRRSQLIAIRWVLTLFVAGVPALALLPAGADAGAVVGAAPASHVITSPAPSR